MKSFFKGLTTLLVVGLMSVSLATSAFASNSQIDAAPQFSTADTQLLFEQDNMPMQVAALSEQEMYETEGAWGFPGAIVGGVLGGVGYIGYTWGAKTNFRWSSFGAAVGIGAGGGAICGPVGWARTVGSWAFTGAASYGAGRFGW
jgi:hypothetical protein